MTTKKDLRDSIKLKFGTLSNFARLSKINRYELQKMFARKDISPIDVKAIQAGLKLRNKSHVDQAKLKLLRKAIDDAGGCYAFTKKHHDFSQRLTYMIYNGQQKRESALFKKLLNHFKIEL
jgi:hypothetical protein